MAIARDGNRINFGGEFGSADLHRPLASIHQAVNAGFQDIVLDFSSCTAAFAGPMLALSAQVLRLRENRIDFDLLRLSFHHQPQLY